MRLTKLLAAMAVIVLPVLPAAAQDGAWQGQGSASKTKRPADL